MPLPITDEALNPKFGVCIFGQDDDDDMQLTSVYMGVLVTATNSDF